MEQDNPAQRSMSEIDANLKRVFDHLQEDELPDQLSALLDQLRQQDEARKSETKA